MRVYRLWFFLVGSCRSDLLVADDLGNKPMGKKRVKNGKSGQGHSPAKIPPGWQLSTAQRDFIDDLWQEDTTTPAPALPARRRE